MKILVADDEETILEIVKLYLEKEGFLVYTAEDGEAVLALEEQYHPDLLVLDVMLPGIDGFSLSALIQRDVPRIFLTALSGENEKMKGFSLGADDYITKPFSPKELVARVKAVMRRSGHWTDSPQSRSCGDLILDDVAKTVMAGGQQVFLPPKEYALLQFFMQHPKQTFSRTQLLLNVWNYDFDGEERSVDAVIKRLRQKLSGAEYLYIQTVRGFGYRFEVVKK